MKTNEVSPLQREAWQPAAQPREVTPVQRAVHADIDHSPRMLLQRKQIEASFGASIVQRQDALEEEEPAQLKAEDAAPANRTGMPDPLKAGIEALSGMDLSDVRVHANSDKPAQLNALAYAQGNEIHLAPGQEQHLPHEAWHVVQQRQGRVQATAQAKAAVDINDDPQLEHEADVMGARALQAASGPPVQAKGRAATSRGVYQLVNAYRVEYQHNRKVKTGEKGGVTELVAPIDISFVMPDHSEYFAAERNQEQLVGLRRVQWEMNDDWWAAAQYMAKSGKEPEGGKAKARLREMKEASLPKPTWSDGASITKFIKQTALHFQEQWGPSLNSAIVKGSGAVEDLEAEIRAEIAEKEAKKKAKEAGTRKPGDTVTISTVQEDDDDEEPVTMDVTYEEFLQDYDGKGWVIV